MALLNETLSLWEIGFRWAGADPDKYRLYLPLSVRDNFRVLMDGVLSNHLQCETMSIDKCQDEDDAEAQFYIRYWLDPIYECIEGREFNKKMLKWAQIDRYSFQQWCLRRTIPLPEFWFPPGWSLDYRWDEESLNTPLESEDKILLDSKTDAPEPVPSSAINKVGALKPDHSTPEEKDEKLRVYQRRRIAVQVVAVNLWKAHPEMTMTEMVKYPVIQDLCGGKFQDVEVVRRWLRAIAPDEVKKRRGRPPSKKGTGEN